MSDGHNNPGFPGTGNHGLPFRSISGFEEQGLALKQNYQSSDSINSSIHQELANLKYELKLNQLESKKERIIKKIENSKRKLKKYQQKADDYQQNIHELKIELNSIEEKSKALEGIIKTPNIFTQNIEKKSSEHSGLPLSDLNQSQKPEIIQPPINFTARDMKPKDLSSNSNNLELPENSVRPVVSGFPSEASSNSIAPSQLNFKSPAPSVFQPGLPGQVITPLLNVPSLNLAGSTTPETQGPGMQKPMPGGPSIPPMLINQSNPQENPKSDTLAHNFNAQPPKLLSGASNQNKPVQKTGETPLVSKPVEIPSSPKPWGSEPGKIPPGINIPPPLMGISKPVHPEAKIIGQVPNTAQGLIPDETKNINQKVVSGFSGPLSGTEISKTDDQPKHTSPFPPISAQPIFKPPPYSQGLEGNATSALQPADPQKSTPPHLIPSGFNNSAFNQQLKPNNPPFNHSVQPNNPPFNHSVQPNNPPFNQPVQPNNPPFNQAVQPKNPQFDPPILSNNLSKPADSTPPPLNPFNQPKPSAQQGPFPPTPFGQASPTVGENIPRLAQNNFIKGPGQQTGIPTYPPLNQPPTLNPGNPAASNSGPQNVFPGVEKQATPLSNNSKFPFAHPGNQPNGANLANASNFSGPQNPGILNPTPFVKPPPTSYFGNFPAVPQNYSQVTGMKKD